MVGSKAMSYKTLSTFGTESVYVVGRPVYDEFVVSRCRLGGRM